MIAKRSMEGESIINQQENNESFEELVEDSNVLEDTDQDENENTCQEQSESAVVERETDTNRCDQSRYLVVGLSRRNDRDT